MERENDDAKMYSTIPREIVQQTRKHYDKNRLVMFLKKEHGELVTNSLIKRFNISSAQNGTLLWYQDYDNKFRTGKIVSVDASTGATPWVDNELVHEKFAERYGLSFNYRGCCFGDHQFNEDGFMPKALVADELLAIVLSALIGNVTWFAPPIESEFDIKDYVTRFSEVPFYLFPSTDQLHSWKEAIKDLDYNYIRLSDQLLTLYPDVKSLGLQKTSSHMQGMVARIKSVIDDPKPIA